MNYEKRYKNLVRAIKQLQETNPSDEGIQNWVNDTLYGTKENENEKNIKDLIDELKCSLRAANCQNEVCNVGHEKRIALLEWAIAWVEKQSKSSPVLSNSLNTGKNEGKISSKWTDEDEDIVESIVDYLKPMPIFFETTNGKSGKEYTKEFIKRSIKWLKTIKQKIKEQQ